MILLNAFLDIALQVGLSNLMLKTQLLPADPLAPGTPPLCHGQQERPIDPHPPPSENNRALHKQESTKRRGCITGNGATGAYSKKS